MTDFGINRRPVQRDLGVLNEIYALEESERTAANEKTFRLKPGSRVETLKLTLTEMIGLYMGRNLFAFTAGTELKVSMDSLYEKLQARLCARNAKIRDERPKKFFCTVGAPKSYGAKDDVYTLILHNHALYVRCFSEHSEAQRTFALERIQKSSWRRNDGFDYPSDQSRTSPPWNVFTVAGQDRRGNPRPRGSAIPYNLRTTSVKPMACLIGCLALLTPRLALVLIFVFSSFLERAYSSVIWPVLGFIFLPLTTLAYAAAFNWRGSVSGIWLVLVIVAALIDLGVIGGGGYHRRFGRRGDD